VWKETRGIRRSSWVARRCRIPDSLQPNRTRRNALSRTSGGTEAASAQAYSLNATVVPTGVLGHLTLWPTGISQPLVSTLNAWDGAISSNAAIVPAGTGGGVSTYVNATSSTHLIMDVNGYFGPWVSRGYRDGRPWPTSTIEDSDNLTPTARSSLG
jgi:hypothetical protein